MADSLTSYALCWRIARRDGVTIALTDHDRDLAVEGLIHRAAPGITPSAIKRGDGFDADTMDVTGALTSAALGETDLLDGRWDGARVAIFAYDWAGGGAPVPLGEGLLGAIETQDGGFTAELRGPAALLDRAVVEATSPACRAELGDARCRVAMAARRRFARVTAAEDRLLTLDREEPSANAYGAGLLRWFGGENAGLESAVAASDGASVTLRLPPRHAPAPGTLIELIEGCDKRFETCRDRFANALNFRGEPHLPGIDLLTRYPGA
ncbi:MAG: DUF2163 domain-containing protein [Sphingomonas sp.]|uniref:DUF2163 domain-containing protein n=1 Tax=Sphingomonas sp. TaxID=28214 RepID=UPI0025FAFF7A|nr:DUF2163 domain-containing protein [Sphingomonas sp.]MBX9880674.1 DUF2163 domain-containing protein [Sphingomonas sp.]